MIKKVGNFNGVPVMSSPCIEKNAIYLVNSAIFDSWKIKPIARRAKLKSYFKNLWKAICGKL